MLPNGLGGEGGRTHGFGAEADYVAGEYEEEAAAPPPPPPAKPSQAAETHTPEGERLRRRPLVFVYDMPPSFVSRMLQYRADKTQCTWRLFGGERNGTTFTGELLADCRMLPALSSLPGVAPQTLPQPTHTLDLSPRPLQPPLTPPPSPPTPKTNVNQGASWRYSVESYFHEALLQSPHRTLDPDEADLFFVPVYAACLMEAVLGHADGPWYYKHRWGRGCVDACVFAGGPKGVLKGVLSCWLRVHAAFK